MEENEIGKAIKEIGDGLHYIGKNYIKGIIKLVDEAVEEVKEEKDKKQTKE